MVDEERRPLLSSTVETEQSSITATEHDGADAPPSEIHAKTYDRRDLIDLVAKVAAVVASFAATGLAQAAVGVSYY